MEYSDQHARAVERCDTPPIPTPLKPAMKLDLRCHPSAYHSNDSTSSASQTPSKLKKLRMKDVKRRLSSCSSEQEQSFGVHSGLSAGKHSSRKKLSPRQSGKTSPKGSDKSVHKSPRGRSGAKTKSPRRSRPPSRNTSPRKFGVLRTPSVTPRKSCGGNGMCASASKRSTPGCKSAASTPARKSASSSRSCSPGKGTFNLDSEAGRAHLKMLNEQLCLLNDRSGDLTTQMYKATTEKGMRKPGASANASFVSNASEPALDTSAVLADVSSQEDDDADVTLTADDVSGDNEDVFQKRGSRTNDDCDRQWIGDNYDVKRTGDIGNVIQSDDVKGIDDVSSVKRTVDVVNVKRTGDVSVVKRNGNVSGVKRTSDVLRDVRRSVAEEEDEWEDVGEAEVVGEQELKILEADPELDSRLDELAGKHHMSATNVKSLIHHVLTDRNVVGLMKAKLFEMSGDQIGEDGQPYIPKLTRSKVREIKEGKTTLGPLAPWPLSPIKPEESKKVTLMDLQFSDDEDDEFDPKNAAEEAESEDDSESYVSSSRFSDFGSPVPSLGSPRTPMTPVTPTVCPSTESTPTFSNKYDELMYQAEHDCAVPSHCAPCTSSRLPPSAAAQRILSPMGPPRQPKPKSLFKKRLIIEEPPETIARRTRSKLPLTDTPLDVIESSFVAPDFTPDMYDMNCELDDDYLDFLQTLVKDNPDHPVNDTLDDETSDPEYNFLAEEEVMDKDEFRLDRAVTVTKRELNELLDELQTELFGSEAEDRLPPVTAYSVSPGKNRNLLAQAAVECGLPRDLPRGKGTRGEGSRDGTLEMSAVEAAPVVEEDADEAELAMRQREQLDDQLRKHTQLLTQMWLLADEESGQTQVREQSYGFLKELRKKRDDSARGHHSAYNIANLDTSLGVISGFQGYPEVPGLGRWVRKARIGRGDHFARTLTPAQMYWFYHCPALVYPQLLPVCNLRTPAQYRAATKPARKFMESEDNLLAIGLSQCPSDMIPTTKYQLISEHILPVRRVAQLENRVAFLRRESSKDNAVRFMDKYGFLPRMERDGGPLPHVTCPRDCPKHQLPQWCTDLQSKLDCIRDPNYRPSRRQRKEEKERKELDEYMSELEEKAERGAGDCNESMVIGGAEKAAARGERIKDIIKLRKKISRSEKKEKAPKKNSTPDPKNAMRHATSVAALLRKKQCMAEVLGGTGEMMARIAEHARTDLVAYPASRDNGTKRKRPDNDEDPDRASSASPSLAGDDEPTESPEKIVPKRRKRSGEKKKKGEEKEEALTVSTDLVKQTLLATQPTIEGKVKILPKLGEGPLCEISPMKKKQRSTKKRTKTAEVSPSTSKLDDGASTSGVRISPTPSGDSNVPVSISQQVMETFMGTGSPDPCDVDTPEGSPVRPPEAPSPGVPHEEPDSPGLGNVGSPPPSTQSIDVLSPQPSMYSAASTPRPLEFQVVGCLSDDCSVSVDFRQAVKLLNQQSMNSVIVSSSAENLSNAPKETSEATPRKMLPSRTSPDSSTSPQMFQSRSRSMEMVQNREEGAFSSISGTPELPEVVSSTSTPGKVREQEVTGDNLMEKCVSGELLTIGMDPRTPPLKPPLPESSPVEEGSISVTPPSNPRSRPAILSRRQNSKPDLIDTPPTVQNLHDLNPLAIVDSVYSPSSLPAFSLTPPTSKTTPTSRSAPSSSKKKKKKSSKKATPQTPKTRTPKSKPKPSPSSSYASPRKERQILPKSLIFEAHVSPTKRAADKIRNRRTKAKPAQKVLPSPQRLRPLLARRTSKAEEEEKETEAEPEKEVEEAEKEVEEAKKEKEKEEEDGDHSHLAELMAASTTISTAPRKRVTLTKQEKMEKKKQLYDAILRSDILDTDPRSEERLTAATVDYLQRVKEALSDDPDKFTKFVQYLANKESTEDILQLYTEVRALLKDAPRLVQDFAMFLTPEQAVTCGCFHEFDMFQRSKLFMRKLEIHFQKRPNQHARLRRAFSEDRPYREIYDSVRTLLKDQPLLLDEFQQFMDDEPPPESHMTDFEEVYILGDSGDSGHSPEQGSDKSEFELAVVPEDDERFGTKRCQCMCHDSTVGARVKRKTHCRTCALKVKKNHLYYVGHRRGSQQAVTVVRHDKITGKPIIDRSAEELEAEADRERRSSLDSQNRPRKKRTKKAEQPITSPAPDDGTVTEAPSVSGEENDSLTELSADDQTDQSDTDTPNKNHGRLLQVQGRQSRPTRPGEFESEEELEISGEMEDAARTDDSDDTDRCANDQSSDIISCHGNQSDTVSFHGNGASELGDSCHGDEADRESVASGVTVSSRTANSESDFEVVNDSDVDLDETCVPMETVAMETEQREYVSTTPPLPPPDDAEDATPTKMDPNRPWAMDEDKFILESFQGISDVSPEVFHNLARQLNNRTPQTVEIRFNTLTEMMAEMGDDSGSDVSDASDVES